MKISYVLPLILVSAAAHADRTADINQQLQEFGADSAKAMAKLPRKFDSRGNLVKTRSPFKESDALDNEFVAKKDEQRKKICSSRSGARVCLGDIQAGRAPIQEGDMAENLADKGAKITRKLTTMESKNLMSAELEETPWSDNYWPIYQGQLAARYADSEFPNDESWKKNRNYSAKNDFMDIFQGGDAQAIDNLSPAEKYDLLVGDAKGNLTSYQWAEGEEYANNNGGKVETWMGICHGWAPAAYMIPRPKKSVKVTAADGQTELTFYPADIKALASLLWAKTDVQSRFIGGRCGDKKPRKDRAGRIQSEECFDTNPGTWHMAVVNQIGVSKRSFVLDATYDYEVWNQPVFSYSYTYFNPQTRKAAESLEDATVALSDFSGDKFSGYRSEDAVSVVGIAMDVTYVVETDPTHAKTNSPDKDATKTARYLYDLELDSKGNIIGGEWYHVAHPDFLWTPEPDDRTVTDGDRLATGSWSASSALPASWQTAAARTSRKAGSPLAKIVEALSKKAHSSRE